MINTKAVEESQNTYAKNSAGVEVYVGDVPSGRKGYFCMGCERAMEAVKTKIQNRKQFFRHVATDIVGGKKCTYTDENYRHKLATEVLLRSKRVKVPALYKFSTHHKDKAMLIDEAKFIEASSVSIMVEFYEDQNGNIRWGRNAQNVSTKILIADVVFFNQTGAPILIIQLVSKHKLSESEQLKFLTLGIDAISVKIPVDSPESITEALHTSSRTKWIFNYEQQNTQFLYLPDGSEPGIRFIDEEQRRLFEESSTCRKAQIRNLIRRINLCLQSEQYRAAHGAIREEISRIEQLSVGLRSEFEQAKNEYKTSLGDAETIDGRRIAGEILAVEESIEIERTSYRDLERRYLSKNESLSADQEFFELRIQRAIEKNGGMGADFEKRRTAFIGQRELAEQCIGEGEDRIGEIAGYGDGLEGKYAGLREAISIRFEYDRESLENQLREELNFESTAPIRNEQAGAALTAKYRELEKSTKEAVERELRIRDTLPGRFEDEERLLNSEFARLHQSAILGFEKQDFTGLPELARGYQGVLSHLRRILDIHERENAYKRLGRLKRFLTEGT